MTCRLHSTMSRCPCDPEEPPRCEGCGIQLTLDDLEVYGPFCGSQCRAHCLNLWGGYASE